MNYNELKDKISQILDNVAGHQVIDALDQMEKLSLECRNKDFAAQLEQHRETYRNMLKYSFELSDDPEKEKVYKHLIKSILELADDVRDDIIFNKKLLGYYIIKAEVERDAHLLTGKSGKMFDSLSFQKEIEHILGETELQGDRSKIQAQEDYQRSLLNIFRIIWMTDKFHEDEINLVSQIIPSRSIPWYDKCILVSSLTLSLIRHFDIQKAGLLFDFFGSKEDQVWQRALTGLVLGLYFHDRRLKYYPEIESRLKLIREEKNFSRNIEAIILQYLKARETEKVTRKIREEIFPEMMKIKSTLEEKLDLEDISSIKNIEEKNPEWETVFRDTPDLYEKLEEFSALQMEGSDVFISAFAMLKRFDFFDVLSNWFLPFYRENEYVTRSLENLKAEFDVSLFVEGLERSTVLCNSDKYSFCLNIKHMPLLQRTMMMEMFNMEIKAMNELSSNDEMLDKFLRDRTVYTQYLQDFYRFFKLHPLKNEFQDVFDIPAGIEKSYLINLMISDTKILRNIGEFYFEKGYYQEAINIISNLPCDENNFEVFEKIAYCYQKLGNFRKAIENYHKAELFDKNKIWIYKKLAFCYRKLGDFKSALKYYREIEKEDPENLYIQLYIGHTYMDMEDFENALKYYFKVEYKDPSNHKIYRPIAWSSFVTGKFDTARKYFEKAIRKEANKNDFANMGHVEWCTGDKKMAIENYKKSLIRSGADFEWLTTVFDQDRKYLMKYGIKEFDIPLMIDYLRLIEE
jgi:tetratricopeptide (TPR) repeat protein